MNDPQVWTLIGVFSAVMFSGLAVSTRLTVSLVRAELRSEIHGVRREVAALESHIDRAEARLGARIDGVEARIDGVESRLDRVEAQLGARIDGVEARLDGAEAHLGARIDGVELRLEARIGAVEARLEARIDERADHLAEVMSVRLDSVHHRLGLVEDDMKIVKAHLLRHSAA